MPEHIPTSEKLARALEQAGAPTEMIARARAKYYDDFEGHSAFNILELVNDAQAVGLTSIALRAMNDEFDAQDWEADLWAKSKEGQETFAALVASPPVPPRGPRKPYRRKRANKGH